MQSQFLYYYHVPSDAFLEILSKEIKIYESFTTKNIEILDKIRKKYFIKVEKLIQTGLSKKYEIKFGHYGSFFTNLSIEGSDVDIRVYYKPLKPNLDFLKDIINLLNSHLNEFDNINPILSASVPVINLQINISQEINYDTLKFMSYFEKKDISHINIDLTFTSDEKEFKRPEEIVNYINKNVKNYEDIRPLLLVIKRYFRIMKMNKSFTGGLSSYSLFLLILAFLKNCEEKMNLGKLLYYFMEKYSFYDFKNYGIDVEGKDLYYPLDNIKKESDIQNSENYDDISEHARTEEIKILDPLTKLNVAKSSFRLDEIKNTFNKALYFLKFESWKYQNEGEENIFIDDFNIIRKLFTIK
jgi:DNA polymerase sigma